MSLRPHAFVAMPFGVKPGKDGQPIDFNRVYAELIGPALDDAGLSSFRADEETRAGDIRTDMFQELLIADLVVADLSIDNPNVWYELGVRHALRSRGVVLVSGGQTPTAFDLYTDRKLRYTLKDGGPDPATLAADRRHLAEMIRATMESWHGRKVSPVYNLMPNLQEPDWKSLRVGDVREFWQRHDEWQARVDLAQRTDHPGDVLVLADEAPVAAFRAEAWIQAGQALRKGQHFGFALEQLERGLDIEPENLVGLCEKGICLQRLAQRGDAGHSAERAREHYRQALKVHADDPEVWALLGRVDKDAWTSAWRLPGRTPEQHRDDAAYEDALLRAAIDSYARAFRSAPGHYFSGINALTLAHLARHLGADAGDAGATRQCDMMAGAVGFAASCEARPGQAFWAKATLGDLEVLIGTPETVQRAYKEAIAHNEQNWFALHSCRDQLLMLADLGFRPEAVAAGLATFDRALARLKPPAGDWVPRQVLLFSGHMVDAPDRATPRFPADREPLAAAAIGRALDDLGADAQDLAYCQAAAGGDLLFLEACQQRGVQCRVMLPLPEPAFIAQSIDPSTDGPRWRDRFYAVRDRLAQPMRVMDDVLGPTPAGESPFERCNRWLLYTALADGLEKVRLLTLWNGGGGDGPGGTSHMYEEVKRRTGRVTWLDTRQLW